MSNVEWTKSNLRKRFLNRRASMSEAESADLSSRIALRFFDNTDFRSIRTLHTFIRIARFNEIDTSPIYRKLWSDRPDMRTVCPKANFTTGEMEHVRFDAETEMVENSHGIPEPASGETVDVGEIDLILVPLLAFDARGHRVGYGRGFYDRFLAAVRPDCLKVGLSYDGPVELISDAEAHDVRIDLSITPDQVFESFTA